MTASKSIKSVLAKKSFIGLLGLTMAAAIPFAAHAQISDAPIMDTAPIVNQMSPAPIATDASLYNVDPDFCINTLASFQTENPEARYQFYALTQEVARDASPEFRRAIAHYSQGETASGDSILGALEDATNPVLRQAAPELTLANFDYVIDFASQCQGALSGQISSLKAYDPALGNAEFNALISEDALFLRQILSDSLSRLGADQDPRFALVAQNYADALIRTRDAVEFETFVSEVDELEALYMTDLDGRLKRSNDMINEEIDREVLGDAVGLSNSMDDAAARRAKEERILSLIRIMGGRL